MAIQALQIIYGQKLEVLCSSSVVHIARGLQIKDIFTSTADFIKKKSRNTFRKECWKKKFIMLNTVVKRFHLSTMVKKSHDSMETSGCHQQWSVSMTHTDIIHCWNTRRLELSENPQTRKQMPSITGHTNSLHTIKPRFYLTNHRQWLLYVNCSLMRHVIT